MDKLVAHEARSYSSGSSGYSDLTGLENETDEFGRVLLRHQRDQHSRIATNGGIAFPKARARPRLADRLKRSGSQSEEEKALFRGAGQPQQIQEPQIRMPRDWGSKAKKHTGWLRDIYAAEDLNGLDAEIPQRNNRSPTRLPRPVNTGDMTPPSMRRKREASSPNSMRHMNTTIQSMLQAPEDDFSATSLLTSTPTAAKRFGYRGIDELTKREVEDVERRRVTQLNLNKILERSPNTVGDRPSTRDSDRTRSFDGSSSPSQPMLAPGGSVRSRIPRKPSLIGKENMPATGDAAATFKSIETVAVNGSAAQGENSSSVSRPTNKRNDSISLLRKLARVSSVSPATQSSGMPQPLGQSKTSIRRTNARAEGADKIPLDGVSAVNTVIRPTSAGVPYGSGHHEWSGLPEIIHPRKPDHGALALELEGASLPQTPEVRIEMPTLLGGVIESPKIVFGTDRPDENARIRSRSYEQDLHLVGDDDRNENLPQPLHTEVRQRISALSDVLQEDQDQTNPLYGESTIASLEGIVNPQINQAEFTLTAELEALADQTTNGSIDVGRPLSQLEKDRRQEILAMEQMDKHLRAARTSIKDANRDLRRVEHQVDSAPEVVVTRPAPTTPPLVTSAPTPPAVCPICKGGYESVWRALWYEVLELFYTQSPASPFLGVRLTWLGLFTLLWISWFVSETTLCSYFCHPMYAEKMIGFGVDPDAPIFPFVIPTLLFRPLRWLWKPACEGLWEICNAGWQVMFGENASEAEAGMRRKVGRTAIRHLATNTFADDGWARAATATAVRVAQSTVDVIDEAGSMWDDDYFL